MKRTISGLCIATCAALTLGYAQGDRTGVPMGDILSKALASSSLTTAGAHPFHIRINLSEPENPQSPYQGSIEEWWSSPEQWRREISARGGLKQVIVFNDGVKTEQDTGDYFPLWLRNFVDAAFDPIPDVAAWTASGIMIDQITKPNGAKSDACARVKSTVGSGDSATDAFTSVCFDDQGLLMFYGSPRYAMEFHDYRPFGKEEFPRILSCDPEPGTKLIGDVAVLQELSQAKTDPSFFSALDRNDDRFQSVPVSSSTLEVLRQGAPQITWPPVHSGNVRGHLAIYISADATGQVREAWPLNSDNAGLQESAREQVRKWQLRVATNKSGQPVQVDGALGFSFATKIGDPLPELNDAEVRALATKRVEPVWAIGTLKAGDVVQVQISVDQRGKLTGVRSVKVPPEAFRSINQALREWIFTPLIRDGKPQYFHGNLRFVVH